MNKFENYVIDGKFYRTDLASDIARLKISRTDLMDILNSEEIQKYYFSSINLQIKDKSKWSNEYLQNMVSKSVAECFTKEYLVHLYDVAIYVKNKKTKPNKGIFFILLLLVVFLFSLILFTCERKGKREDVNQVEETFELESDSNELTSEKRCGLEVENE